MQMDIKAGDYAFEKTVYLPALRGRLLYDPATPDAEIFES